MKCVKQYKYLSISLVLSFILWIYGVGTGHYKWPPYQLLVQGKQWFHNLQEHGERAYSGERELLNYAFTDPIISGELLYSPITSLQGIKEANESIYLPIDDFFSAYKEIFLLKSRLINLNFDKTHIKEITYKLHGKVYQSFAYGPIGNISIESRAVLIIPGSGHNQSSGIYKKDLYNYHNGVLEAFKEYDIFVFIKPNEDILAFHDGTKKLNTSFFINWHLNHDGSYSASYIAQSLAFTKYLKENYKQVIVAGLSQGGAATLLNALQSEPNAAIISSGYSVINDQVSVSDFNQIIIPGVEFVLKSDTVRSRINEMQTEFFFSWGKKEKGAYRIEAEEQQSCNHLMNDVKNIECVFFDGGHVFPVDEIRAFLIHKLGPT